MHLYQSGAVIVFTLSYTYLLNFDANIHLQFSCARGRKCTNAFPHHNINVTTKHTYEIDYKYVWECEGCGLEYKRHSKSIDTTRQRCGRCKSALLQIKPKPRKTGAASPVKQGPMSSVPSSLSSSAAAAAAQTASATNSAGPSAYQLFMKANYSTLKSRNPGMSQKELMTEIGSMYRRQKAEKQNLPSQSRTLDGAPSSGAPAGDVLQQPHPPSSLSLLTLSSSPSSPSIVILGDSDGHKRNVQTSPRKNVITIPDDEVFDLTKEMAGINLNPAFALA